MCSQEEGSKNMFQSMFMQACVFSSKMFGFRSCPTDAFQSSLKRFAYVFAIQSRRSSPALRFQGDDQAGLCAELP